VRKQKASVAKKPSSKAVGTRDVVDWLRSRIRRGLLTPGQRLVEADITRETGAARSHVREALKKLEAESIVIIEEFRGASVKRYSRDDVRQIYDIRMALEGLAAANFAAADDPAAKERLARLQQELNNHERDTNHEQFARANDAWHAHIIDMAGNAYLKDFLDRLHIPIYWLLHRSFFNRANLATSNTAHRAITKAILDGEPKTAERLMRAHLADGLKALSAVETDLFD
jgi:DNA-binding GntR family transcriptional regulator